MRSNDLHTADLALLLAERIDGSAIANEGLDRNHVDLNRIDEVSERAPALFAALALKFRSTARMVWMLVVLPKNGTRCWQGIALPRR